MPIKDSFGKAEKIGVIGSPSSTGGLTIDVLGSAVEKRLVGNLSVFHFKQDDRDHYALGQITEITMKNTWTEDPTMRGIIRHKGRVDPVTEKQDVHMANMTVSSVFCEDNGIEPSILGTVPATGTPIRLLNTEILDSLLENFQNELFYLGLAYGTTIKMPMWLKHFGKEAGGIGEAYHIGVFGKTGSGKSVLAKMVLFGYAKNKDMSIFILDPQGEFSQEFASNTPSRKILESLQKKVIILNLQNLVFDYSDDLFKDLLIASGFFNKLKLFYEEHPHRFFDEFINILEGKGTLLEKIKPWNYYKRDSFDRIWNQIPTDGFLKSTIGSQEPRDRVKATWNNLNKEEMYKIWLGVTNLFKYKVSTNVELSKLFSKISEKGAFVIIDLSSREKPEDILWNDDIQLIAIQQFLSKLTEIAGNNFKTGGNLNTLVVIDEAHRWAPKEKTENEKIKLIKYLLIDAIRTTRKFGLGWMFVSQTLSSLDKEIINQIRIFIFGFGLAWGLELQSLREIIGGNKESIRLYQMFKDPQSSIGEKEYSFMSIGPISPLSFSGTPLFFSALRYPDEFLKANFEGIK